MRSSASPPLSFARQLVRRPELAALCALFLMVGCARGTNKRDGQQLPPSVIAAQPWTPPASAPMGSPVAEYGQLQVLGTHLSNADGDSIQLKGISSMWLNFESKGYAQDKAGLAWLRDNWKLKVFRAAMGVEGQGAYLGAKITNKSKVQIIVRNAIDLGVYVIIDWHDHHAHVNVEDAVEFFGQMAEEFGGYPNVIYEPFNEPQCKSVVDGCGPADRLEWPQLKAYHERVVAAIRAKDPDNVIILGTPTWSQDVDKAAADPLVGDNLMYTLHFYSCTHKTWLIDRAKAAIATGLPLFVTEWGATNADGGLDGLTCLPEAQEWQDFMNEEYISWAAWKFDACSDSSCFFKTAAAPTSGGWDDSMLGGHAPFVRDRMKEPAPPRKPGFQPDAAATMPSTVPTTGAADGAAPSLGDANTVTTDARANIPGEAGLGSDGSAVDAAPDAR